MITQCEGTLFDLRVDALVNPVNCVGVMGKGLAAEFKTRFPGNFAKYKAACDAGMVRVGTIFPYYLRPDMAPQVIYNFPTKDHWRNPSRLKWVEDGLLDLVTHLKITPITSIGIPALGCGEGGLGWHDVYPRIVSLAAVFPDIHFLIYPPQEKKREHQKS